MTGMPQTILIALNSCWTLVTKPVAARQPFDHADPREIAKDKQSHWKGQLRNPLDRGVAKMELEWCCVVVKTQQEFLGMYGGGERQQDTGTTGEGRGGEGGKTGGGGY